MKYQQVGRRCCRKLAVPLAAGCIFAGAVWQYCRAESHDASLNDTEGHAAEIAAVNADSLRAHIRQLRSEALVLRNEAQALRARMPADSAVMRTDSSAGEGVYHGRTDSGVTTVAVEHQKKDTVQLLSKETVSSFLGSFNGRRRTARERGYGGGIGPAMGIYAIGMGPVDDLVGFMEGDAAFRNAGINIHDRFTLFQMSGITFYGAVGNGLRIGGSFLYGSRSYSSRRDDTTYNLEIKPSFGGFLLEKAMVFDDFNMFAGAMIGSGTIRVCPSKTLNPFTSIPLDDENGAAVYNELKARSLLFEFHGGGTYTMINWFHLGAELSAPVFFSPSGFTSTGGRNITNGFVSINPGIRLRIIIGNIG